MMLNRSLPLFFAAIATVGFAVAAKADTVNARCDVYPKGEDRAKSSGPCTFSQRQGAIGIQLPNGRRYDLTPVGSQAGNYRDQNGRAAYREDGGLGNDGEIYRLATESIYVYWDPAPYNQQTNKPSSQPALIAKRGIGTLQANSSGARINVRSQPTIRSSSPQYGLSGDKVEVIRCVQDKDTPGSELNWCNVRFVKSKATGWVRSDFIIFADGGE